MLVRLGDQIPLQLQLWDGSAVKFPRAVVKDASGAAITGSPFALTHVADGHYSILTAVMPATPFVTVQYLVFSDAGFTTMDPAYSDIIEVVVRDTSATPATVWDEPRASHVTAGTFGGSIQANLDVDVSTRAPASTALSTAQWTNTRAGLLDFLDVAISTRLSAVGYTTPDNAGIAAIQAKTDNLPVDPASETTVNTRAPASTALSNAVWTNAKAVFLDIAVSSRATSGGVWDELLASHVSAGTFGLNAQTPSLNPAQVASAVWDALTSAHMVAGSFGLNAQTPSLNAAQVAAAVWNALTASYVNAGSFGLALGTGSGITPTQVAVAVWDALISAYNNPGTFGEAVQSGGGGGGSIVDLVEITGTIDPVNLEITGIIED